MRLTRGRAAVVSGVLSYGVVQLVVAAGSIVRLPYLIDALGPDRLGLSIAVGNLAPLLLAATGGVRLAARTLIAEAEGAPATVQAERIGALLHTSRRVAWLQLAGSSFLVLVLPLHRILQADGTVGSGEFLLTLLLTAALCAGAIPGSASWGRLEAEGRLVLVNSLFAAAAVLNLLATVALVPFTQSFAVFTVVNVASSALPFYLASRLRPLRAGPPDEPAPRHRGAEAAALHATGVGTVQNAAPFAIRAMDPLLVSARLGPAAAAELGVGQRIAMVTTLAPVAAGPLVNAAIARRRGTGRPVDLAGIARIAALYMALAGAGGGFIVWCGPAVARFITRDELDVGTSVFVALAVLGVTSSAHNAFLTAGSGPSALRFALRLDVLSMTLNAALSLALLVHWGMIGPIYASVAVTSFATISWFIHLRRRPELLRETHVP